MADGAVTATPLVGISSAVRQLRQAIDRTARCEGPVLIEGESGTGKLDVAREIHRQSARARGPLEIVCCASDRPDHLEAELFRGTHSRPPTVERCYNGSVVLHEISQLPAPVQTRLSVWLRQHGGGWSGPCRAACRFLGSSSADLEALVQQGSFRCDLYYQLCGDVIRVPPLRERTPDIPLLVQHLVALLRTSGHVRPNVPLRVSPVALDILTSHQWLGNLDELYSVLRRGFARGRGELVIPSPTRDGARCSGEHAVMASDSGCREDEPMSEGWESFVDGRLRNGSEELYAEALERMEASLLPLVMAHTQGNQSRAAKLLGITRASLRKKLRSQDRTLLRGVGGRGEE